MKTLPRFSAVFASALLLVLVTFATSAAANTLTLHTTKCPGDSGYNSDVDTCNYTINYSINDTGTQSAGKEIFNVSYSISGGTGSQAGFLQLFSVTAFTGSVSLFGSQPSNGNVSGDSSGNNGNSTCTGGTTGSICFLASPPFALGPSTTFSTSFQVLDTALITGTWNVKTNVTGTSDGKGGNIIALSTSGQATVVPEPASMLLLGTGLLGLGGLARRRFRK